MVHPIYKRLCHPRGGSISKCTFLLISCDDWLDIDGQLGQFGISNGQFGCCWSIWIVMVDWDCLIVNLNV